MRTIKNLLMGLVLALLATYFDFHLRRRKMTTETKQAWRWVLVAALVILVVQLLSGCIHYTTPITSVEMPPQWYAMTNCDQENRPVIILNANYGEYPTKKYTLIHEQTHVAQIERMGSCNVFLEHYRNDPQFHWNSEAEARCAEMAAATKDGVHVVYGILVSYMHELSLRLELYYTVEDILKLLPCKEVSHVDQRQGPP